VRLIKANRSTQHWSVELTQQGGETAAFATAVFAVRRPSWSHRPVSRPEATRFEDTKRYPKSGLKMTWVHQYDFRFVEGQPLFGVATPGELASPFSKLWIGDTTPRRLDALSLVSMSDAFFARIFHVRNELVPFGTVSLTTYFHADAEDLIAEDATHVLAVSDASVFHKSYGDQTGALWSPSGKLLATTQQIAYFKA
jgi:acyl-CoA thioesterase